jgi:hypothetical protein
MNFESGDIVYYTPTMENLAPPLQRPWDMGIVLRIEGQYLVIEFLNNYISKILPTSINHHPHTLKAAIQRFREVLPDISAAVQARVAALVFSEKTGHTAVRGLGPADILRSFLEPPRQPTSRKRRDSYIRSRWPSNPHDAPS